MGCHEQGQNCCKKYRYFFLDFSLLPFTDLTKGHDYLGRSSGPDTLQIWTHDLNSISISENYTPDGGSISGPAVILGAGAQAKQGENVCGDLLSALTRAFSLRSR